MGMVVGYRNGRATSAASPFSTDFPPYPSGRQSPPFQDLRPSFREPPISHERFRTYRQPGLRQDSPYDRQSPFRNQPREYRTFKERPFYSDQPSYRENSVLKESSFDSPSFKDSSYTGQSPFRDQPQSFGSSISFRNEQFVRDRPSFSEQPVFQQQQATQEELRSYSDSPSAYRDETYDKPINSYREIDQQEQQTSPFNGNSDYLKYGNHGFGFHSISAVSPYVNSLALNEEMSTTTMPSTPPTATHKPLLQSTVSSTAAATTDVRASANSNPKTSPTESLPSRPKQNVNSITLADAPSTASTEAASPTPKQSSSISHTSTALTTVSGLSIIPTKAPTFNLDENALSALQFPTSKFSDSATVPSFLYVPGDMNSSIRDSLLNYLLAENTKNSLRVSAQNAMYLLPNLQSSGIAGNTESTDLNNLLSEGAKSTLKDSIQSTFLNYFLQQQGQKGLSFQQSSNPETLNYVPLAMAERPKFSLPSIPIASLSAVSRPLQTVNYVSTSVPRVSYLTQDLPSSSSLASGSTLSSGLSSDIRGSLPTSIHGSLPTNIAGGLSAGIPDSMSAGIPTSIPTLNLGQSFQHMGQMRQFETPSSSPYSTGLQLQLGGFGGIDYALRPNNPTQRPMALGIAKVGLSLPELPRPHVPAFAKIGFGQRLW
ncbi:hypothetical protein KM043_018357 [Ampulex compressa]|nr:hypothetical protein KM043_018357 [Ampulex compressa]